MHTQVLRVWTTEWRSQEEIGCRKEQWLALFLHMLRTYKPEVLRRMSTELCIITFWGKRIRQGPAKVDTFHKNKESNILRQMLLQQMALLIRYWQKITLKKRSSLITWCQQLTPTWGLPLIHVCTHILTSCISGKRWRTVRCHGNYKQIAREGEAVASFKMEAKRERVGTRNNRDFYVTWIKRQSNYPWAWTSSLIPFSGHLWQVRNKRHLRCNAVQGRAPIGNQCSHFGGTCPTLLSACTP